MSPFRPWPSLAVAIAFALLIAGLTLINRQYITEDEAADAAVAHSFEVLADLNATVARLVDAETGQRGFLITGEERYLDPYRIATADVDTVIDHLAGITGDNPEQEQDVIAVRALAKQKLDEMEQTIAVRRRDGFNAAQEIVLTDRGRETMDRLRAVTSRVAAREELLLAARQAQAQRSSQVARLAALFSTVVAMAAVALVWFGYRRVGVQRALAEQRVQAALNDAEEALEVKNQFLAAVSHELRTPINAIVGWSRMLHQRTMRPDKVDAAIASIDSNAHTLAQLIEDLLESSRLLTGKVRLASAPVEVPALVADAVDTIRLSAENKGVTVDVDAAAVRPIRGDGDRLKQVLWNVIGNAVKFTPPGGRVAIRVTQAADAVLIAISDTGAGIAPALLPHVFDPFRQGEESTRSGLGLGLAIARQLIELHGGTIEASSAGPGRGATFTIRLPAAA